VGTKTEIRPGVWRLRVVSGYDPVTGNPRQVSRTVHGGARDANRALAAFVTEVDTGQAPIDGKVTLDVFLQRWLEHLEPHREAQTIRGYRFKVRKIDAKLGRVQVGKLSAQMLDRTYREWHLEGLSDSSVHHLHRVLSAALRQAVKWGLIARSPTERASPPPLRRRPAPAPTPDDVRRLIDVAAERNPILATVVSLAATTGLRRGELCGLRWSDIDLDGGTLHVRRSVKRALDDSWTTGDTKSHKDRRLALDPASIVLLRAHRVLVDQTAQAAGVTLVADPYVLTMDPTAGQPWKPDTLGQAFGRLCAAAGVNGFTIHSLRHFAASYLIAGNIDVRTVAGRLGHSDATTTLRVYAHLVESRDQHAADLLGGLISGRAAPRGLDEGRPVDAH
jgi:integrase